MKFDKMLRLQKSPTEQEILKGCRKRDPKSQKALFEKYSPKMLAVCIRYIKDKEESEFIMVGAMVKVFEKVDQFQDQGSFEGWIRKITVNECLMHLRKNKVMEVFTDISSFKEINISAYENHLDSEDLLALIHELPIGYRTVFNLYAIEGYSHQEIAQQLDINENTSKSQLSRARKWLQARLSEIEPTNKQKKDNYEAI